jgi:hypothetical protein
MSNPTQDMFKARMRPTSPKGLRDDIDAAFGIVARFGEHVATIRDNKNLTNAGRENAMRDVLGRGLMDHFRQLQQNVKKAKDQLASQRAALVPPGPDKADIFRELQRREMRDSLGKMPVTERIKMALESKNPLVVEAILFAPEPVMIGLPAGVLADVARKNLEAVHGPKLKEFDELEEDISNADAALQVAEMQLRQAAGMDAPRFNQLVAPPKEAAA